MLSHQSKSTGEEDFRLMILPKTSIQTEEERLGRGRGEKNIHQILPSEIECASWIPRSSFITEPIQSSFCLIPPFHSLCCFQRTSCNQYPSRWGLFEYGNATCLSDASGKNEKSTCVDSINELSEVGIPRISKRKSIISGIFASSSSVWSVDVGLLE